MAPATSKEHEEKCHRDYSLNIYKVPGHSDCSRDGYMRQAGPKSFLKSILRGEKPFPLRLPTCRMSQELLEATLPSHVEYATSASGQKKAARGGNRIESCREVRQGAENGASCQEEQRPAEAERGFGNFECPVPPLMP